MPKDQRLAIGIDVGATKTASALVTRGGEIVAEYNSPTNPSNDPTTAFKTVGEHIKHYQNSFSGKLRGIGIGAPGWHNAETGIVKNAVNIGWDHFNLVHSLRERYAISIPIFHQTDAIAETVGEYYYGAAKNCSDFVYLGVGSGLGSGFFSNNQVVTGHAGMAGGIGHYAFGTTDVSCVCGLKGCIEQQVGGIALYRMLTEYSPKELADSRLQEEDLNDAPTVLAAALDSDELALKTFAKMGKWLGVAMSMYITLLNPKLIVLGGGLGKAAYSLLIPEAKKEIKRRTLSSFWKEVNFKKSSVRTSAMGAASLVWEQEKGGDIKKLIIAEIVQK